MAVGVDRSMKTLLILMLAALMLPASASAARRSHVRACAAEIHARCQIRSVGGGVAVPFYVYRRAT